MNDAVDRKAVDELTRLVRLEHEAVQAHALVVRAVRDERHRAAIQRFQADHERHVMELSRLVREYGGTPPSSLHPSPSTLGPPGEGLDSLSGDRDLLRAYKAYERRSRDRLRDAARRGASPQIAALLSRHAVDEVRHYSWALATLDDVGAEAEALTGVLERAVELGSARTADVAGGLAPGGDVTVGDRVRERVAQRPIEAALIALGAGFLMGRLAGRRGGEPRRRDADDPAPGRTV